MEPRLERTPVALYARVSSERQDVDLSVAAQLRALREFAERHGYVVDREYIEEAESGRVADRPQFRKMLRRRGIRVTSITEHADDSPTGRLMEAIIESVDEFTRRIWPRRSGAGCARPPLRS